MRFVTPGFELADQGTPGDHPFRHCLFGDRSLLDAEDLDRLTATFPGEALGVRSTRLAGGDKSYEVTNLPVYDRGEWQLPLTELDTTWRQLITYLSGRPYLNSMMRVLQLPPAALDVEIRLTSYAAGGWMSRHTDRPEKVFSHNLYLCPGWQADWGGALALYDGADAVEPASVFWPGAGTSLAFARSDTSWHEVQEVTLRARQPRRAILVHGYLHPTISRNDRES